MKFNYAVYSSRVVYSTLVCIAQAEDSDAVSFYRQGIDQQQHGDLKGAIAKYTRSILLNPRYVEAYLNRGVARQDQKDLKGAIADFDKAIELSPRHADAYNNRGIAKMFQVMWMGRWLTTRRPLISMQPTMMRTTTGRW